VATNSEVTEIIPFTQDELEAEVKQILISKGLTDIVYPGSNISQLSDVMTYLVHALNTNTAINLQEVILPLATKRMNVLYGARQVGYEAVQRTSYRYKLTITILENTSVASGDTSFTVRVPKYTKFKSGENTYVYFGEDIAVQTTNNTRHTDSFDIIVKEGELIKSTENDLLNIRTYGEVDDTGVFNVKQDYTLPFKNVEEDGIEIFLTYVDENGVLYEREEWTKSDQFLIDSSFTFTSKKFARAQNIFLQMPTIYFELGGYGNPLRVNTLIEANILISSGLDGVATGTFTFDDSNAAEQLAVSLSSVDYVGTDVESIESIKENASIFNNSANRAVTALDYIALSQRHPLVKYAKCWGGEDEIANTIAQIYLSFSPERTVREFMSTEITDDGDDTNDNIYSPLNISFNLQDMPRHPFLDAGELLATDFITNPDFSVNDTSDWIAGPFEAGGDGTTTYTTLEVINEEMKITNTQTSLVGTSYSELVMSTTAGNSFVFTVDLYGETIADGFYIEFTGATATVNPISSVTNNIVKTNYQIEFTADADTVLMRIRTSADGDVIFVDNAIMKRVKNADEFLIEKKEQVNNWYLDSTSDVEQQTQIVPGETDNNVFTYLNPYKIMTMHHNFRQLTYVDFSFQVKVVKYNLSIPEAKTNESVFTIINEYFRDYVEKFDAQFFISNLQRRMDKAVSETSGVVLDFGMEIPVHEVMYAPDLQNTDTQTMVFKLAFPFANMYQASGDFQPNTELQLPIINTPLFSDGKDLYCLTDVNGKIIIPEKSPGVPYTRDDVLIEIPIYLGTAYVDGAGIGDGVQVGSYYIRNGYNQFIEVHLIFEDTTGTPGSTGYIIPSLTFTDSDYGYVTLKYPGLDGLDGDNVPFIGNTMPRLKQVNFI